MCESPYSNLSAENWCQKTDELIEKHPLNTDEIVEVVLRCWNDIFDSKFGEKGFRIGVNIFPKPQIMGFLLHELIPLELASRYPDKWRGETTSADKDVVYVPDAAYSIEIKTSSHPSQIFGNRSYAQKGNSKGKKSKSGYYLAVNFGKCIKGKAERPKILRIRFGWLDHSDWTGQKAATGQQARLPPEVDKGKFAQLFPKANGN